MESYWSPFLVELEVNKENGNRVLKLDQISASAEKWKGADIMVFNSGYWWTDLGTPKSLTQNPLGFSFILMENLVMETLALKMEMNFAGGMCWSTEGKGWKR